MAITDSQIRDYLLLKQGALQRLSADLQSHTLGDTGSSRSLILTVDWSEVFTYAHQRGAPAADPAKNVLGDALCLAAHRSALAVLFEKYPGPLILLPPYIREYRHFLDTLEAATEYARDIGGVQGLLDNAYSTSAVFKEFHQILQEWRSERRGRRRAIGYEQLVEIVGNTKAEQIRRWIDAEFAQLFLIASHWRVDSLGTLRRLTSPSEQVAARVQPLVALLASMVYDVSPTIEEIQRWEKRLREQMPAKRAGSRYNDAEAMAIAARLNAALYGSGCQLLFATRSSDILSVLKQHAFSLMCLGEPYRSAGTRDVPSVIRTWHYFFEFGVTWNAKSPPESKNSVSRRLAAVAAQLESLNSGNLRPRDVQSIVRAETRNALKQQEIFLSVAGDTVAAPLPEVARDHRPLEGDYDIVRALGRVVVDHATRGGAMEQERRRIYEEVQGAVRQLRDSLADVDALPPPVPVFESLDFRSATRALLLRMPLSMLGLLQIPPEDRRPLAALVRTIASPQSSKSVVGAQWRAHRWSSKTNRIAECLLAFVGGRTRRLKYLLGELRVEHFDAPSGPWLLSLAMNVDCSIALSERRDTVLDYLNLACSEAMPHTGSTDPFPRTAPEREQEVKVGLRIAAALNMRLAFFLNCAFPRGLSEGDLRDHAEGWALSSRRSLRFARDLHKHSGFLAKPPRSIAKLRQSVVNNLVYAWASASHEAWELLEEREDKREPLDERERERDLLRQDCLAAAGDLSVAESLRSLSRTRDGAQLDTVILAHTVFARLFAGDRLRFARHVASAERAMSRAKSVADARTQQYLAVHGAMLSALRRRTWARGGRL